MIKEAILKVYQNQDLTYDEAYQTMDEIMSGEASEVQMSDYLTAMSMKGETIEVIINKCLHLFQSRKLFGRSPAACQKSRKHCVFGTFLYPLFLVVQSFRHPVGYI